MFEFANFALNFPCALNFFPNLVEQFYYHHRIIHQIAIPFVNFNFKMYRFESHTHCTAYKYPNQH